MYDWEERADLMERLLLICRNSPVLLNQDMAEDAGLCGPGILSWRKATKTTDLELPAMEVIRRTLAARPRPNGDDDHIQYERKIAEWSLSSWYLHQWIIELDIERLRRRSWLYRLFNRRPKAKQPPVKPGPAGQYGEPGAQGPAGANIVPRD